jgi:hypothetical protein
MMGMRSLFVLAMLSAQGAVAAESEPPHVTPALRQRAEDLAGAASQRFTDILDKGARAKVAQDAGAQAPSGDQAPATGTFAPVWNWLYRAQKSYDDVVIAQLKNPNGWTVIVQKSGEPSPSSIPPEAAAQTEPRPELKGWSGFMELVRDWLARANRSYRNEIITPLREPGSTETPSDVAKQPAAAPESGDEIKRAADEEAQARSRSLAAKRAAEEDEAKRRAQAETQVRQRADTHASKRAADEAEVKRLAEERAAIARRRADEDKRRADAAEAERKAKAEQRARDIEAAAAARRKADGEARAAREAEAKRVAQEATKRREEEAKRQAAEADAAERKAVAEAEAESKRTAEIEAEATRRSQEAAKAKEAARTKRAEQAKEPARADVTQAQSAPSPAAPAPAAMPASPPKTPAIQPTSPPKAPAAAPASSPPAPVAKENSAVAAGSADAVREEMPATPVPKREATPKAREESAVAEAQPQPTIKKKSLKRSATKWRSGKKQAYVFRYKKHHGYKHRQTRRAYAHVGRRRWASSEAVAVERRCDCRCGGISSRPRKHKRMIWGGDAPVRLQVERPYRARVHKHRQGRLISRHRRYYID